MANPYYERDYYLNSYKTIALPEDGSISALQIKDEKALLQQKYVMTERLVAERRAGRALCGMLFSPLSNHLCVRAVLDSVANTNVIVNTTKLLASANPGLLTNFTRVLCHYSQNSLHCCLSIFA